MNNTKGGLFIQSNPPIDKLTISSDEPTIDIEVTLSKESEKGVKELENLLSAFGIVGSFLTKYNENGKKETDGFRASLCISKTKQSVTWCYEWGTVEAKWLTVLLECLECFSQEIEKIISVKLKDTSIIERE